MDVVSVVSIPVLYALVPTLIAAMLCAGGSVGGTASFLAIFAACGLSAEAVPLTKAALASASLATLLMRWAQRHPNPQVSRPLVQFDVVLLVQPMCLLGGLGGALLCAVLPSVVLDALVVTTLLVAAARTCCQGWRLRGSVGLSGALPPAAAASSIAGSSEPTPTPTGVGRSRRASFLARAIFAPVSGREGRTPRGSTAMVELVELDEFDDENSEDDRKVADADDDAREGAFRAAAMSSEAVAAFPPPPVAAATAPLQQSLSRVAARSGGLSSGGSEDARASSATTDDEEEWGAEDGEVTIHLGNSDRLAHTLDFHSDEAALAREESMLQRLEKADASLLPCGKLVALAAFWLLVAMLLCAQHRATRCGEPAFWILLGLQLPLLVAFTATLAALVARAFKQRLSVGYRFVEGDPLFTPRNLILVPAGSLVAGVQCALLDPAGTLNALMLRFGLLSSVAYATSNVVVLLASGMASLQFWLLGRLKLQHAAPLVLASFVGAIGGELFRGCFLRRSGIKRRQCVAAKRHWLHFAIAAAVAIAAVAAAVWLALRADPTLVMGRVCVVNAVTRA